MIAEARPKQTSIPAISSSTTTLPYHLREWIDVEPGKYDKSCSDVSKKMTRLLRHDPSVLREEDGAVEFRILAPMFRSEFTSSPCWSIRTWLNYLQKGGSSKEEISVLCGSKLCWYHPIPSSNSRPLWRKTHQSHIAKTTFFTERLRRAHLPRWKLP